ncbi:hypothetical protein OSTOST_05849, partial [Ostertagia ostertagi]
MASGSDIIGITRQFQMTDRQPMDLLEAVEALQELHERYREVAHRREYVRMEHVPFLDARLRTFDEYLAVSTPTNFTHYTRLQPAEFERDLQPGKMCAVQPSFHGDDTIFEQRVIRLGPCEIDWDYDIMIAILAKAYDLSVPIVIYGDIHGQYSDIWRWFHVNGWPPETPTLFLGDYVDRGRHSTETYNFYSELKARYPKTFKKIYRKITDVF